MRARSGLFRPVLESLGDRVVPSATRLFAIGQDVGGASAVQVYNEDGSPSRSLDPFGAGFTGGVRVVTADVTGDGTDDIVAAAGVGGGPAVKVFDGVTGAVVREFFAYAPDFRGGVNVAAGDVNADGFADIVVGTGVGGGPNVRVFDGATEGELHSFFAYESGFRGGVNVAVGDITGDGRADIITGTGTGGGPRVQAFDAVTWAEIGNFFAYDDTVRSGVTVAVGDVTGDGVAEIVTGAGFGSGPNVRVFDRAGDLQASFFAADERYRGGVTVGVVALGGAGRILVAPGPSLGGSAALFTGTGTPVGTLEPFPGFRGGITTGQGVATLIALPSQLGGQKKSLPPAPPEVVDDPIVFVPDASEYADDFGYYYPEDEWVPVYDGDPGFPLTDYGEPGWFDDAYYF
jgi:hypothetical protein